jgi:hypothetical protein
MGMRGMLGDIYLRERVGSVARSGTTDKRKTAALKRSKRVTCKLCAKKERSALRKL